MSVLPVSIQRVWREVKEVNAHFFNLRTILKPNEQNALMWYFVLLPNDGAHAHLPLIGRLIIPNTYPEIPPVVQLYNTTGRYNVDVYHWYITTTDKSTLCFDILRPESAGGTWKPEYTLSSLFASLMAAIVSFYVPQEYGSDQAEYVSMEKLVQIKKNNALTYHQHSQSMLNRLFSPTHLNFSR
jgi:ubiquitin-protein ligase